LPLVGDQTAALTGGGYAWLTVGGTPTTAGNYPHSQQEPMV